MNGSTSLLTNIYGYDAMSRLASVGNGTHAAHYTRLDGSGLLSNTAVKTSGGTTLLSTDRAYDAYYRMTSIASTAGATTRSYAYTYNDKDQRTACTLADGTYWEYAYDDKGQVTGGIKYDAGGIAIPGMSFGYDYDGIGNRKQETRGIEKLKLLYTSNLVNQYTSRVIPGIVPVLGDADENAKVKIIRNDMPMISAKSLIVPERDGRFFFATYNVDNSNSAKNATHTVYAIKDDPTNSGRELIMKTSQSYHIPKRDQMFTYDPDGNMTSDGKWQYTWNGENRLVVAEAADKRLEFTYDYMGRRVRKQVYTGSVGNWTLASESKYIYDGYYQIAEFDGSDNMLKSYLRAGGEIYAVTDTNQSATYFFMTDGNKNIMALVDESGNVQADYTYDPFGRIIAKSGAYADINAFRFSSEFHDDETNLVYYNYRYYSPDLGRWLSRDPIEEQGGYNLYGMVGNNPISYFDVLGFKPWFNMRIDEYDGLTLSGSIPDLLSDFIFQPVNTTSNKYNEALDWFERRPYKDLIREIKDNPKLGRPCSKISKSSSSIGPSPGNTFFKFKRPTGYKIPEKLGDLLLNAANAFTGGATYQNSAGANLEESNIDYTKKFDYLKNNYINFPKRHKLPYVDNNLYPAGRVSNSAQLTTSGMLYLLGPRTYPEINVRIDCSNQCYDITFKQFGRNTRLDGASDRIPLSFLRSWYSFYDLKCPLREGL